MGEFVEQPAHLRTTAPRPAAEALDGTDGGASGAGRAGDAMLRAEPRMVHFGGFRVGQAHEMKLRVVNTAPEPRRLVVTAPTTEFFSIRHAPQGPLASGMAESITVVFQPAAYQ